MQTFLFFHACTCLRFFKADAGGRFNEILSLNASSFVEQRHRSFGRCYTLNPEERIRRLGVYYVRLKL